MRPLALRVMVQKARQVRRAAAQEQLQLAEAQALVRAQQRQLRQQPLQRAPR